MKENISNIWIGIFKVSKKYITLSVKILYTFVSTKFINILIKALPQMYYTNVLHKKIGVSQI